MSLILIVEDDVPTQELLCQIFTGEGYECLACAEAEEVDGALKDRTPSVALCDINLPGEHGVSLAWRLRQRLKDMPIIVLSSALGRWDVDDILDSEVDAVMAKPFDLHKLKSIVREAVEYGRDVAKWKSRRTP
jgi:two-component system, response regulator, stage 0 sporulation protein F